MWGGPSSTARAPPPPHPLKAETESAQTRTDTREARKWILVSLLGKGNVGNVETDLEVPENHPASLKPTNSLQTS